ncbi:MAG: ECF transporter S component [Clostridia bacterium]|nr:ECF transporter S component [Clostridia bacterium]
MERTKSNYFSATRLSAIALFGALSAVLYVLGFSISGIFPYWLELNFSDIPALIGTFSLGPVSGALIIVVKILIKLLFKPTSTIFVGELADLLIGLALVVPAGIIYKKNRTFKGALLAVAVGSAASVAMGILANWLVLIPFYLDLYFGGDWGKLVGPMQALFPSVTQESFYTFYLWGSVLPFNFLRCLVAVLVTLPIYKHISRAVNHLNERLTPSRGEGAERAKKINLGVLLGFIAVLALGILFVVLRFFLWK